MSIQESDIRYMQAAIAAANEALSLGEVPVGAVLVWDEGTEHERVIAVTHNTRESEKNALGHAECNAISDACKALGGGRLHRATLYVTLEPCPMCMGAIISARIKRVVYGASDARFGALGSLLDLTSYPFNHKPEVLGGVCREACEAPMQAFFARLRQKHTTEGTHRTRHDFMK